MVFYFAIQSKEQWIMQKPIRTGKYLLLAATIIPLAGLQHLSGDKQLLSCSPSCGIFSGKGMAGEVFAAGFDPQSTRESASAGKQAVASSPTPIVHPEVPRIPAIEVKEMLAKKADFVLVDTNPADHFEMWHIPTAVNLPYTVLMNDPEKAASMIEPLPNDKLIVLYCLCVEGGDSSEVALFLRSMGFRRDKVKVLEGGLITWDEKGYPVIKKEIPE